MFPDRSVVDTNVLVYAHLTASPQHADSLAPIDRAKDPAAGLCVFPQMVAEFFAIVTNPKRVTTPMDGRTALTAIDKLLAYPGLTVLPVPTDIVPRLLVLLRAAPVTGPRVFDYQIAAVMLQAGISTLYTYNTTDFAGIPGIVAKEPPPAPPATAPTESDSVSNG